ncbi:prephenate dehydratase [Vitiosangium sp. GDMCC 1.1324]|uniref:prephenate dehydratase n=1 Tax=Vitiosangium sp. (strain GDMCC 1.1324) TaxID=2138576 RepID=UPI000D36BBFE|nr:prephenate dehydratase [Vitiosangium sp. GDMCC 1.1324]PTL83022.1 prephenate dehydratase [Vitiosangium sp. GDMCC 1.1324]
MRRISLLGPGTFSEESALHFLGEQPHELVPFKLISEVFQAVVSGRADLAVIPIENTLEGSVSQHLDWLVHEVDLPIQAEWVYPITMNLLGPARPLEGGAQEREARLARVRKVLSHPVALGQCRQFLRTRLPQAEVEPVGTTAEGARQVRERSGEEGLAAIGSRSAAKLYGLELLAEHIEDHPDNATRFVLVGPQPLSLRGTGRPKTSLLITLPADFPGALHQVLSAFARGQVNLVRIESRPTRKKLGNYFFFIDVEAPLSSEPMPAVLAEIESLGCSVRVLGSYLSHGV